VIVFYRIIFPFIAVLVAPYYLLRMLRRGGYGSKLHYRLGLFPSLPPKKKECKRIWIQAVSVGELSSLAKILTKLKEDQRIEIVLTGTTSTGLRMAAEKFSDHLLAQGPFPLDWWLFSGMAWSRINPDLIITVDSELWPEHFHQAANRGIPALVINARLSDRTYRRLNHSSLARIFLLPPGLEVLTTSERQRSRWSNLGVPESSVFVVGNLKVDAVSSPDSRTRSVEELKAEFGFSAACFVLVGLSTWPGEEELLVETLREIRKLGNDVRLLLIPRHAERGNKLCNWLEKEGFPYHARSRSPQAPQGTLIYLADTTGELPQLICVADLAFGGKTLPPNQGGQNPIEPIAQGIPLVLGPNYQNFRETCSDMLVHDAIRAEKSQSEVKNLLLSLIQDQKALEQLSESAIQWMKSQSSPSDRTLEKIYQLLQIQRI